MSDATIPSPTGDRLDLLKQMGFNDLMHDSHVPFMSHLLGVRRVLVGWDERAAMCDAGLFHSAYGTDPGRHATGRAPGDNLAGARRLQPVEDPADPRTRLPVGADALAPPPGRALSPARAPPRQRARLCDH